MSGTTIDLVLDAVGQRCPLPVILLAKRIGEVALGGIVSVLADDPAAALDLPAWCGLRGQEYVGSQPAPGGAGAVVYLVRRVR